MKELKWNCVGEQSLKHLILGSQYKCRKENRMQDELTLEVIERAVAGNAAAFRSITKSQPSGGPGSKVFPPTYVGGVYAVEDRRIGDAIVPCVLLDSVQSQANRMEEALLDAFLPTWREMKVDAKAPKCDLPIVALHIENHGWITSLTTPHRIHDAILRDSRLNDSSFRESNIGKEIVSARPHHATAFYKYCPTVLLFGTWDSTSGEGANAAKIPRAVVSEIIGVNIVPGVRTRSRIDPLGIRADSAKIYRRKGGGWALQDEKGGWIGAEEENIEIDAQKKHKLFGKGKPSDIVHGNVTPDIERFGDRAEIRKQHLNLLPDILSGRNIEAHAIKAGGVTMEYAMHTWTLSLAQLRRLRFPIKDNHDDERNNAARTVLATLAIYALALQHESYGYCLRSRCDLVPESAPLLEQIGGSGSPGPFMLGSADELRGMLDQAIKNAEDNCSLGWQREVILTQPLPQLLELVKRSDARGPEEESEEELDAGAES